MVIVKPVGSGKIYTFRCQPTFAKKCQQRVMTIRIGRLRSAGVRGESLPSDNHLLNRLKLELAYFGGKAWQSREVGGAGVILRFERVIPAAGGALSAAQGKRDYPEISHPNGARAQALEI
jgi:hypothetical protein